MNGFFAVGGLDEKGKPSKRAEFFDYKTQSWYDIRQMNIARDRCAVAVGLLLGSNNMFVTGGVNSENKSGLTSVESYSAVDNVWLEATPLTVARHNHCAVTLDNHIYVMGGKNRYGVTNSCERFIIVDDRWEEIAPMKTGRTSAAAAVFKDKIFVVGGKTRSRMSKALHKSMSDPFRTKVIGMAEYYLPQTNQWTVIEGLQIPRSSHSLVTYNGSIYAVGGTRDKTSKLKSVEIYTPGSDNTGSWKEGPSLNEARSSFGLGVIEIATIKTKFPENNPDETLFPEDNSGGTLLRRRLHRKDCTRRKTNKN